MQARGLWRIATGLAKKIVIGDFLAQAIVNRVFATPERFTALEVLLAVYAYAVQIYADFSGYSDVAIGSAALFGYELPENFDAPYVAQNLQEFWHRWHISLSTWLRDYLYKPLGGSRGGSREDVPQPDDHDGPRRPVARRLVELRHLGGAARRRARRDAHVAAARRGERTRRRALGAGRRDGRDVPLRVPRVDLLPRPHVRARDARAAADGARDAGSWSHVAPKVVPVIAAALGAALRAAGWERRAREAFARTPARRAGARPRGGRARASPGGEREAGAVRVRAVLSARSRAMCQTDESRCERPSSRALALRPCWAARRRTRAGRAGRPARPARPHARRHRGARPALGRHASARPTRSAPASSSAPTAGSRRTCTSSSAVPRVIVTLRDGRELHVVEVLAASPDHDLALVRVEAHGLPALALGDSDAMRPGDPVVAIGNPMGLEDTVSNGLVSARRKVEGGLEVLQVSAPIAPGSSGGPVFNDRGEVIGVATAVVEGGQNLAFGDAHPLPRADDRASPRPCRSREFATLIANLRAANAPKVQAQRARTSRCRSSTAARRTRSGSS